MIKRTTAMITFMVASLNGQDLLSPKHDLTITPTIKQVRYCLGLISSIKFPDQPERSDITLFLKYSLRYENRLPRAIIVPVRNTTFVRVRTVGTSHTHVLSIRDQFGTAEIAAMDAPDQRYFTIIPALGSSDDNLGGDFWLRLTGSSENLLGKTIEVTMLRDHDLLRSLALVQKEVKWAPYGTIWRGAQESEALTIEVPKNPQTVDCMGRID